jgi:hypothetical protein
MDNLKSRKMAVGSNTLFVARDIMYLSDIFEIVALVWLL